MCPLELVSFPTASWHRCNQLHSPLEEKADPRLRWQLPLHFVSHLKIIRGTLPLSFLPGSLQMSLETTTCSHVWKFNFGKYRFPDTMHWGAFAEWQAASGVSTILLCEKAFLKEAMSTFQTWIPHTEFRASAVVVGNLLLFWVSLEPRNRPEPLYYIFKARHASEAAKLDHSCVVALGHTNSPNSICVHCTPLNSHKHIHVNGYELHFYVFVLHGSEVGWLLSLKPACVNF